MIDITVRCGCSRTMRVDATGPGRYRCGCGAQVALSGLPKVDARHCALPKGNRICNGPKRADAMACEPCSVSIAKQVLADTEAMQQLGTHDGAIAYKTARIAEQDRMIAEYTSYVRPDRRPDTNMAAVVYYCELRPGIVKIGTTTDLAGRMSSLHIPRGAVLAAEPGHYELEKARHREFADLRIGKREDFRVDEVLRAHIEELAMVHGDAYRLMDRLRVEVAKLAQDRTSELSSAKVG